MPDPNWQSKPELNAAYDAIMREYRAERPGPPRAAAADQPARPSGKEELLEAWDRLVDHEASKPDYLPPPPSAWRRYWAPVTALVATIAALYLSLAQPRWLYPTFELEPVMLTDAAAEQYLVTAAMLAEAFHEEHGRFPVNGAELGFESASIALRDLGDSRYEVRVRGPSQTFLLEGRAGGQP